MNLSERIRSCLSSPKTAADVHSEIGSNLALIRGCIQTMVKAGLLERIGETKPYRYRVARPLKNKLRGYEKVMAASKAQQIRDWLKQHGPATNAQVSQGVSMKPKASSKTLCDMRKRGYVSRSEDGYFAFLADPEPVQGMSEDERREANRINNKRKRDRAKNAALKSVKRISDKMTISMPKPVNVKVKAQSVDEWLKQGNKIDRSPTPSRFERLTHDEIVAGARRGFGGYQTPQTRRFSQCG